MWLAAFALAALPAPCDCTPAHAAERVFTADLVFTAQVFRSALANIEYIVSKRYKGKAAARVKVYDLGEACQAPRPVQNREYLVLARRSGGLWVTGPCEGAIPVEDAQRYFLYLSAMNRKPVVNVLAGQILFPQKTRVPTLVRLRKGATTYYATADDMALFAFENVPAGDYSLEVSARGFRVSKATPVRVSAKGITHAYVRMEPETARSR